MLLSGGLLPSYLRGQGRIFEVKNLATFALPTPTSNENQSAPITANLDFFVRNHFTVPTISAAAWNLTVDGAVSSPLKLAYDDLLLLPSIRRALTFECAGNVSGGRGVGNALWSGLPLSDVLKKSGIASGVTTVVLHGADSGQGEDLPANTNYARAIPLEKAMDPSTLLAYEMNGSPLPPEHGFPVRALVAGWYGMDSVKWLTRIELTKQPFDGYFQREHYVAVTKTARRPLTNMLVSSRFLRPSDGEEIRTKQYRLEGVAWAGEQEIVSVEVRITGSSWRAAKLSTPAESMAWTAWSYDWTIPAPGKYTLAIRATDRQGRTQPDQRDPDRQDAYELNTPHEITVITR
jgi:DMSO/TMAO reductase YedYZ molybdopterin-dependent catalytic subunit